MKKRNEVGFFEDSAIPLAIIPALVKGAIDAANGGDFDKSASEFVEKCMKVGAEIDDKYGDLIAKTAVRKATKVAAGGFLGLMADILDKLF
jgi:hypothetical protein